MIKTFTQDDVIRYVYEETSPEENLLIEDALMSEPDLMTFFLEALELRALMNRIERQPRRNTVQSILNYSKQPSGKSTCSITTHRNEQVGLLVPVASGKICVSAAIW